MSFEVEGKLHKVFDTENKSATFQAREFVIEVPGQYPNYIKFQLTQDRCAVIDPFQAGEQIKVHFDLRGRVWNEKYFTNLNAWRIEKAGAAMAPPPPTAPAADNGFPSAADAPAVDSAVDDDLPF